MSKIFSLLCLATILTACGNGSSNDQPAVGTYAYTQNGVGGQGTMCPPQVAMAWNQLIASQCGSRNGQPMNGNCSAGIDQFRMDPRIAQYIQGPGCAIVTSQLQWCPGNGQPGQNTFQINDAVLQGISTQNGPGSYPVNGQGGYVGPGYGR